MKALPEPLNGTEMQKLMSVIKSAEDYDYMIFRMLLKTGRRIGEIWSIKLEDVDFENSWVTTLILKRNKTPKGEPRRKTFRKSIAFLDAETLEMMKKHVEFYRFGTNDYIFRERTIRTLERHVKKYAERAGISKYTVLHSFRHFFITFCRLNRMTYEDIAKLTGHAKRETIARYDHLTPLDIEDTGRKIAKTVGGI